MVKIQSEDQRIERLPRHPLAPTHLSSYIGKRSYDVWVPKDRCESVENRFGESAGTIVRFTLEAKDIYLKHWFGGNERFPIAWYKAAVPIEKEGGIGNAAEIVSEHIEDGDYHHLSEML